MDFKTFYNTKINEDDELDLDFSDIVDSLIEDDQITEVKSSNTTRPRTELDRKKLRAKKDALAQITKGEFKDWDLKRQAQFHARYQYKEISPTKGRYVRREKPLNPADVMKKLRKQSKRMKRLMKAKGKTISKKAQRIRKSHGR